MNPPIKDTLDEALWVTETLPIRLFGDPILTTPCEPVTKEDFVSGKVKVWADQLIDFLTAYRAKLGVGRGLAANQIGVSKQMALVWLDDGPTIYINLKVIKTEGEGVYPESCISAASLIIGEVVRAWEGSFEYTTIDGETKAIEADTIHTRLLLHELDHLQGKICTDQYTPGTIRVADGGTDEILKPELVRTK